NLPSEPWDPRKYLEYRLFWPYSSGIPDQWMVHQIDTVHWFTGLPRPRSVVANGGVYLWNDGRKNWDTATIVFDYGPLDDPSKGFQVVYSSRMTNSAGGTKELYYSNAGMLNLDTNEITPTGGLTERFAAQMGMKANELPAMKLSEAAGTETAADTGADSSTTANVRNWMDCVRSRKQPNAAIDAGYSQEADADPPAPGVGSGGDARLAARAQTGRARGPPAPGRTVARLRRRERARLLEQLGRDPRGARAQDGHDPAPRGAPREKRRGRGRARGDGRVGRLSGEATTARGHAFRVPRRRRPARGRPAHDPYRARSSGDLQR